MTLVVEMEPQFLTYIQAIGKLSRVQITHMLYEGG
jgi:hypothetical protein